MSPNVGLALARISTSQMYRLDDGDFRDGERPKILEGLKMRKSFVPEQWGEVADQAEATDVR